MLALAAAACVFAAHGQLPDRRCTPGAVLPGVTAAEVCRRGYSRRVRHVPRSEKRRDYREYGLHGRHPFPEWEVDHLVPLELGGSNSIRNLWPEHHPRAKDRIEDELHARVCEGRLALSVAQRRIERDWRTALR